MLNSISAQYICKNTKNIQKSDYMDGFCLQGELDLTLFYMIEGCWGIFFEKPKSLMTENDRDLNDRILGRNKKRPLSSYWGERSIYLWMSLLIIIRWTPCSLSHAARYSERSSDSGQYADGYLKNCFPSVRFHFFECWMLSVECWIFGADRLD